MQFLFLNGQLFKIFSSETACKNKLKLGKHHIYKVLYSDYSFSLDPFDAWLPKAILAFEWSLSKNLLL